MKRTIKITLMIAIAIAAGVGAVYATTNLQGSHRIAVYGDDPGDLTVDGDTTLQADAAVSGDLATGGDVTAAGSVTAQSVWNYFGSNSTSANIQFGTPPTVESQQQVNKLVALNSYAAYGNHTYLGLNSRTLAFRAVHHQGGSTCAMVEVNPSDSGDVVITLGGGN